MSAVTRYRLLAAAAVGAAPFLVGRLTRAALAGVVTDTSKLMDLALAISKSSPRIRDYAIEQARVSISQELALGTLDGRLSVLEQPAPAPAPTPPPPAPTSTYLNDLGEFGRPARDWSVAANWHPDSARLLGLLKASASTAVVALSSYGVAIAYAASTDPLVRVTNTNGWGNKPTGGTFLCPTAAVPARGTDGHLVVVQPDGSLWEMWKAVRVTGGWSAGAVSYATAGEWTYPAAGCRGSSFTLASGLLTPDDLAGVKHALLTVLPSAAVRRAYMYPSNDTDGINTDGIPEGARIVLDPAASLSGLAGLTLTIAKAGQTHGWIVGDKTGGTDMSFAALAPETFTAFGQPDPWAVAGLSGYPNVSALLALLPSCRIENQPITVK